MTLRKSLVAAATVLTVSAAGVGVASAEAPTVDANQSSQIILAADTTGDDDAKDNDLSSFGSSSAGDDDKGGNAKNDGGSSDIEADDITGWLGVFTAIIGAVSALAGFIGNFLA